ncbi:hypothetical protein [Curtobacterium aetherium]|uniref:Uncharacterized protein n=1 Tax=Curtobacterium aetherium TaxID=2841594 RepID=A0ACD1E1A1_9MICO|nr:hypothetical protein [Curtobacterium sp. L6-1]QWS32727.1 hypothetical protein KM842_10610 [Curtobacterium sp. L6-1]
MSSIGRQTSPARNKELPAVLENSLYALLLVSGASSLPLLGRFSPLPVTVLLDVWLVFFLTWMLLAGRTRSIGLIAALSLYLLSRVIPAILFNAPVDDFLQAYRWLLYLIIFATAMGRTWGSTRTLWRVTLSLLIMAIVKSAATLILLGRGQRPGLLLENNFELALFAGLIIVCYPHLGRARWLSVVALGALTVMDESRSGSVAFVIVAVYAVGQAKAANLFLRYLLALALPAFAFVAILIFEARARSSSGIDRLNFLRVFLENTSDWSVIQWLFGTTPITPLDPASCLQLSYYESLFSSRGDGTCYSVILHAFNLRVVYDAGLVGLALAVIVTWIAMRKSGTATSTALALSAIALTNGLSVSGLNSPYVALPIILAITLSRREGREGETPDQIGLPHSIRGRDGSIR